MVSLAHRIEKLESAVVPLDDDWRQWKPKQWEAFLYRLRQTAWEVEEWEAQTEAEAERLGADVEEYRARLLDQEDRQQAAEQGIRLEELYARRGFR